MSKEECKQRYWEKKYNEAAEIECGCGCGEKIKNVDHYGRPKKYINGHGSRKYDHSNTVCDNNKRWVKNNRSNVNERNRKYSHNKKVKLIQLRDNKCAHCGVEYDGTNGCIFDFHHLDPSSKELNISTSLNNVNFKKVLDEIEKCIMICSNCHRKAHGYQY